jgi:DNA uptake protein ComE-like DNA-binding protein
VPKPDSGAKSSKAGKRSARGGPGGSNGRPNGRRAPKNNRRIAAKLRRAEQALEGRDKEIAELKARVTELENELVGERKVTAAAARGGGARSRSKRRSRAKLGINDVTFEELRELGLSVTQSARLIANREMRGGFGSLDELDRISGFSSETLADLKRALKPAGAKSRR